MEDDSLSILIVDDLKSARRVLRKMLGTLGFEDVDEAESVEVAIGLATAKTFDVVVSDLHLGEATGIDLFRRLRAMPEYKTIPFILATSAPESEICEMAGGANIPGILYKPFNAQDLLQKIEVCFS